MAAEVEELLLIPTPSTGQAALWSVLTRGVQAASTLACIGLVAIRLDREAQGYFYTFLSLVTLFPLAEFGVSYAMMQSASHDAARLRWSSKGLEGEPEALAHIRALLKVAQRWNVVTTLTSIVVLAVGGTRLLHAGSNHPPEVWQWGALIACVAGWQLLSPRIALLEGGGLVDDVWKFRLVQEVIGGAVLAGGLLAGLGLLSLAASWAARLTHSIVWLGDRKHHVPAVANSPWSSALATWRSEVWPFQWRLGISILCGVLIFQLFTPVLLVTQGAAVAGRFGMTLAVANGLLSATTGWLNSQAPYFGTLVAAKNYETLDKDFATTFRRSSLLAVGAGIALVLAVAAIGGAAQAYAERVLPLLPFALLITAAVVNHMVFALAVYLRAHRREPLLLPTVLGAASWTIMLVWAARLGSPTIVAGAYLGINLLGLLIAFTIFAVCRRRWHLVAQPG